MVKRAASLQPGWPRLVKVTLYLPNGPGGPGWCICTLSDGSKVTTALEGRYVRVLWALYEAQRQDTAAAVEVRGWRRPERISEIIDQVWGYPCGVDTIRKYQSQIEAKLEEALRGILRNRHDPILIDRGRGYGARLLPDLPFELIDPTRPVR